MTEEQIRELAQLSANMAHVAQTVDELKRMIERMSAEFVSRAHHDSSLTALSNRLSLLESKVNNQSPMGLLETATKLATGITVIAAAVGLIAKLMGKW